MKMATPKKIDYKKDFPALYRPGKKAPVFVEVPPMTFFMIDGKGDPNTAQEYAEAIECLYAVSYALKMKIIKKETPSKDYVVPPLEGLWYMEDMATWSMKNKNEWQWTMMIRVPDFASKKQIDRAITIAKAAKNPPALPKLRVEEYNEGFSVQILHIGSYDQEHENIMRIHEFAKAEGYALRGKHHEIYLSDPRKTDAVKLKTVLRQPIATNSKK